MKDLFDHIHVKIFNTETKEKVVISPIDGKQIRFYACGPTVYNFAHIGNYRTYVFEDLLRRTLEFFGFNVKMVMNITDVDDKTIKGAIEKNVALQDFIQPFTEAFFEDLKILQIKPAHFYPRATEFIPQMIEIISDLIDKGYAYVGADSSVYFSIKKFHNYGRLSHLKLDELKIGASKRISSDEYEKDQASDFVLWKSFDPKRDGKIYWESPFGLGRPGWHLECSAMAMHLLGKSIDIHCGGVDNIFPHHENEIAQSECFSGRQFVRVWAHSAHLLVDGKKMSKSLGNFYTLKNVLDKGYTGEQIRYMLLHAHYRVQLNFTLQGMDAVVSSMRRLKDFIERIKEIKEEKTYERIDTLIQESLRNFASALADDLNISLALSHLFDFIRQMHQLCDEKKLGTIDAKKILQFLEKINQVLAFLPLKEKEIDIPQKVREALQKREGARKSKDWALADQLRDYIHSEGYKIEDSSEGPKLKKS